MEHESDSQVIDGILEVIEYVAVGIEVLAVAVIVIGTVYATAMFVSQRRAGIRSRLDHRYRVQLGSSLLVGLEILVAADVVRTVALEPTLENIGVLGILVLIRTFLSWSLSVEIEGHWPWHTARDQRAAANAGATASEPGMGNE